MTIKSFFMSNAGKGLAGVLLTTVILVCPIVASWLVAAYCLTWAIRSFEKAFAQAEREAEPATQQIQFDAAPASSRSLSKEAPDRELNDFLAGLRPQGGPDQGRSRAGGCPVNHTV